MVVYCDPLTSGAIGAASNMVHSKQQMLLLDQTKTVIECAQQLLYATKECGGNPKVLITTLCSCIPCGFGLDSTNKSKTSNSIALKYSKISLVWTLLVWTSLNPNSHLGRSNFKIVYLSVLIYYSRAHLFCRLSSKN